jgi:hypothetical protein
MDTALLYPGHLDLAPPEARARVRGIIDDARRLGGTVTVNWHDRSIAPERLWGGVYTGVLEDLQQAGAWFSTAAQAVAWFRKRRAVVFEAVGSEPGAVRVRVAAGVGGALPGLRLRVHTVREFRIGNAIGAGVTGDYVDLDLSESLDTCVPA